MKKIQLIVKWARENYNHYKEVWKAEKIQPTIRTIKNWCRRGKYIKQYKREKWYNWKNKENKSGGKDKVKIELEKSGNFQSSEGENIEKNILVLKQSGPPGQLSG
jgi:hypothetical protein